MSNSNETLIAVNAYVPVLLFSLPDVATTSEIS